MRLNNLPKVMQLVDSRSRIKAPPNPSAWPRMSSTVTLNRKGGVLSKHPLFATLPLPSTGTDLAQPVGRGRTFGDPRLESEFWGALLNRVHPRRASLKPCALCTVVLSTKPSVGRTGGACTWLHGAGQVRQRDCPLGAVHRGSQTHVAEHTEATQDGASCSPSTCARPDSLLCGLTCLTSPSRGGFKDWV